MSCHVATHPGLSEAVTGLVPAHVHREQLPLVDPAMGQVVRDCPDSRRCGQGLQDQREDRQDARLKAPVRAGGTVTYEPRHSHESTTSNAQGLRPVQRGPLGLPQGHLGSTNHHLVGAPQVMSTIRAPRESDARTAGRGESGPRLHCCCAGLESAPPAASSWHSRTRWARPGCRLRWISWPRACSVRL